MVSFSHRITVNLDESSCGNNPDKFEAKAAQLAKLFNLNESIDFNFSRAAGSKEAEFERRVETANSKYSVRSEELMVKFDQIIQDLALKNYDSNHKNALGIFPYISSTNRVNS
jgi:hypothetical protein